MKENLATNSPMKLAGLYGYMTIHSGVKTCSLLSFSSRRNSTSTSEKENLARVDTPMITVQATLNSSTGLVSYFNFTNLHLQKGSCKVTVTVICRGNPQELRCCPSSCPVNHFVHTPLSLHFGPWAREQRPTCKPNCVIFPSDCQ